MTGSRASTRSAIRQSQRRVTCANMRMYSSKCANSRNGKPVPMRASSSLWVALTRMRRSFRNAPAPRVAVAVFAEVCVFAFFILLAWVGYSVLEILAYDNLVSLPEVSVAWAQSVIPISAVLFIIAEALTLPKVIREARRA